MPKGKLNKIYALIEKGLEDECIALLKEYGHSKVKELQKHNSIWHLAVRKDCKNLLEFLIDNYHDDINCIQNDLIPWCLALTLHNVEVAKMLAKRGANKEIKLNEQGQTLLHLAVIESDMKLLNTCIASDVNLQLVDNKGYTALFYAHLSKNKKIIEALQMHRQAENANVIDLHNSVIKDDSEALQILLDDGVSPILKHGAKSTLLDQAVIHKSTKVEPLLRAAGIGRALADSEVIERRRQIYSKKPNPLLTTYAMEKLSLKKSEFKISVMLLMAISIAVAFFTALIASSLILAIGAGIVSGLLYVACVGKMHFSKVNEEKELKSDYKKALDQKRAEVLKLAEQINTEKNAELLTSLANEINEASQPTFGTTEAGYVKISGGKLLLIDKQIERLKKVDVEIPEKILQSRMKA